MFSLLVRNAAAAGRDQSASRRLAIHDYACVGYHGYMLQRALLAPDSHDATTARWFAFSLLTTTLIGLMLSRGRLHTPAAWREPIYRAAVLTPIAISYFELKSLLASLQVPVFDGHLLALDKTLFGQTPSLLMAPYSSHMMIEWFAFFYYSYFPLLLVMILPSLFHDGDRRTQELRLGALLVFVIGHIGYTIVPAYGPYATIAFDHPLPGGFWWNQVLVAVRAGALMDVFPSLHTAFPSFFVLHAYSARRTRAQRIGYLVLTFFAANIVVSTMVLRWHYAIDVLAGLALASFARYGAVILARYESE